MSLDSRNTASSEDSAASVIHVPLSDSRTFTLADTDTTDQDSEADLHDHEVEVNESPRSDYQLDFQHHGASSSDSETDLEDQRDDHLDHESSSSSENTEIWIPSQHGEAHHRRSKPTPPPRPSHLLRSNPPSQTASVRHSMVSQNSVTGRIETALLNREPIYVNQINGEAALEAVHDDQPVTSAVDVQPGTPPSSRLPSPPHSSILRNPGDIMPSHIQVQKKFRGFLHTVLSCIYALVLATSGLVLPVGEAFAKQPGPGVDIFFIYLYLAGILFMVGTYAFMLRHNGSRRRLSRSGHSEERDPLKSPRRRRHKVHTDEQKAIGSFYLRLGAVGFGIGAMIHEGLSLGELLEHGLLSPCVDAVKVTRTISKLTFIFIQLYAIFLNAKINMERHATISKYGLMHLLAVNLCLWSRTVVTETLRKLHHGQLSRKGTTTYINGNQTASPYYNVTVGDTASVPSCQGDGILRQVVASASCYLYPCSVEYALIALGVLLVMWMRLTHHDHHNSVDQDSDYVRMKRSCTSGSVDCSQANRGMFLGVFIIVASIIAMIIFFVLSNRAGYSHLAFMVAHTAEVVLYIIATIAVCIAFQRMNDMLFSSSADHSLDEALLWISLAGVLANAAFGILPARYEPSHIGSPLTILRAVVECIQAIGQTIFIMCTLRRSPCKPQHESQKPGRELVTFLIACNVAMWGLNSLEVLRGTSGSLALSFFGLLSWSIFKHLTTPMAIFYRFHSTVCLANIWKNAYKVKSQ